MPHTCPRRMQEFGPWEREEDQDTYLPRHGIVGSDEPCCSFCGSLPPYRFMELVEQGYIVGPTDKDYKVYLSRPYTDDEREEYRQRLLNNHPEEAVGSLMETVRGEQIGKFYFQHLLDEQKRKFVDMLNKKQVVIGNPGYFYRLPFFVEREDTSWIQQT